MNAISVIENRPTYYFKFPKEQNKNNNIWDYAATACIFKELGYWVSTIQGKQLELNSEKSTFMNKQGVIYANSVKLGKYLTSLSSCKK